VEKLDYAEEVEIKSISEVTEVVYVSSSKGEGYYDDGMLVLPDSYIPIRFSFKDQENLGLILKRWSDELHKCKQVNLLPGCGKTKKDCEMKFNNLNNFGGFPLPKTI